MLSSSRVRKPGALVALGMALFAGACMQPRAAELYPQLSEYSGREIDEVSFPGHGPISADTLSDITQTEASRCEIAPILPFCFPFTDWGLRERYLDLGIAAADVERITAFYRQNGFFGTRVVPEVDREDDEGIHLMFRIFPGDTVVVDSVVVEGTEGIVDPDSLAGTLSLKRGQPFRLTDFIASAEEVRSALQRRGHAYAEILRNYGVDTIQDRATAWLVAVPGPRVVIDSISVSGLDQLNRGILLRQITFEKGDLLQLSELRKSQRNLYDIELVQFASVSVAPDSLQLTPDDSTTATVQLAISEAPEHVVEAQVGWGSVQCMRANARWVDRSFFSGARRLTISGSSSRLGIAAPTEFMGFMCTDEFAQDTFATGLDYQFTAELYQPYFLNPQNQITATVFAERQSEPHLFQRTAQGGRLALTRRLAPRHVLNAGLDIEYRKTDAVPVLYCIQFAVCGPSDIGTLSRGRWRNAVTAAWLLDRGNRVVNPTRGYVMRASTMYAAPPLGSNFNFVRGNAEHARYFELAPGWVAAGFIRAGTFLTDATLGTENFIPPEERFFAGGPSSVRGFSRNELGPGVYVAEDEPGTDPLRPTRDVLFFPIGGTSVSVLSAELRMPSPFLRELVRTAVFIDAGTVGTKPLWKLRSEWRVTPGVGLRISTPVGPARIDLAYNPYGPTDGPLFESDGGDLVRVPGGNFRPEDPGFWGRLRLHVAVGQAF